MPYLLRRSFALVVILFLVSSLFIVVFAQDETSMTEEEMVEHGAHLIYIAGCISCHTPPKEEYSDFSTYTVDDVKAVSFTALETLDLENKFLAGGRPFDLGPFGVVYSANLTPDDETGLGTWTDEEIEIALRIGVNKDGRRLHPLMPYANYFRMADSDVKSIIAYLRTLTPVENEVDRTGPSGEGIAPELVIDETLPEFPPDGSVPEELGAYLVLTIMSCSDCHTPLDPDTGIPMFDLLLAGGQAYEGPWGIVYGGNITPHDETGIGTWEGEDIERVIREGVRIDGRRLILMPWEDYAVVTDEELDAVVAYLQSLTPVDNEVPAPSIEEPLIVFVEDEE